MWAGTPSGAAPERGEILFKGDEMNRRLLNMLALAVIMGGAARLDAQTQTCCTAASGATCCGDRCRAGQWSCCANTACDQQAT